MLAPNLNFNLTTFRPKHVLCITEPILCLGTCLELELEREFEPDPLESEPESLERDFRRFFLVLL